MAWSSAARAHASNMSRTEGQTMRRSSLRGSTGCTARTQQDSERTTRRRKPHTGKPSFTKRLSNGCTNRFKRASNGIGNYEAPNYGSLPGEQVDTGVSEILASSRPPSTLVSTAPKTSLGTAANTDPTKKRSVHFPAGYDEKDGPFKGLSWEEKVAKVKEGMTDAEAAAFDKRSIYQQSKAVKSLKATLEERAEAQKATESRQTGVTTKRPFGVWDVIDLAKTTRMDVATNLAMTGGAIPEDIDAYTLVELEKRLSERFTNSIRTYEWPLEWKDKAKPNSDDNEVTGLLLGQKEKKIYEDWWVQNVMKTVKDEDGSKLPKAVVRDEYRKYRTEFPTLTRSNPICSQLTNFRKHCKDPEPPEFDQLTKEELAEVTKMREIEDRIIEKGGTSAAVNDALDQSFGPEIDTGHDYVNFPNLAGRRTGRMGNGTFVTMTCGRPSSPPGTRTVDTSMPNPFCPRPGDAVKTADWETRKAMAAEVSKQVEADKAAAAKAMDLAIAKRQVAIAKQEAKLTPMPSKNGATTLSEVSKAKDADPIQTWGGHDISEWGRGVPDDKEKVTSLYNRWLTLAKFQRLRPPGCDPRTATQAASFIADDKDTSEGQLRNFFEERGIPYDDETAAKINKSTDRMMSWNDQKLRDWGTEPTTVSRKKAFHDSVALKRLISQADAAQKFPTQTLEQSYKIGTFFADMETLAREKMKAEEVSGWLTKLEEKLKSKLAETPTYAPDKTTTAEALLGEGAT